MDLYDIIFHISIILLTIIYVEGLTAIKQRWFTRTKDKD